MIRRLLSLPASLSSPRPSRKVALSWWAAGLAVVIPAHAAPILHERIPDDAASDLAMGATYAGDIPAVMETPNGFLGAPDPRRPPSPSETAYGSGQSSSVPGLQPDASFYPDRDTRRPDTMAYDDPFTPSTAPFKRLVAFDAVRPDFSLTVAKPDLRTLARGARIEAGDDRFFADIVIDAEPGKPVRIPSVGPDARVVHAHLAAGTTDLKFNLVHDQADNWFIDVRQSTRARLVMDLTIKRAVFGGDLGHVNWTDLPRASPLPANVAAAARSVAAKIGVGRDQSADEAIKKLIAYFRAFRDSEEPPPPQHDVYTDLALAQKGVCRHRAFAFLITALGLGIPSRMVVNEAHAWVEVHDGRIWHRIDLGGAGRMLSNPLTARAPYQAPSDAFGWPPGATRGEDIAGLAQGNASSGNAGSNSGSSGGGGANGTSGSVSAGTNGSGDPSTAVAAASSSSASGSSSASRDDESASKDRDARPRSTIEFTLDGDGAGAGKGVRRGQPIHVHGRVSIDRTPCFFLPVEFVFRESGGAHEIRVGSLATDGKGEFAGDVVIPSSVALGDYDLSARTQGDLQCGASK